MARRQTQAPPQPPFKLLIEEVLLPPQGRPHVDRPLRYPLDMLAPATRLSDGRYKGPSFFVPESMDPPQKVRGIINAYSVKTRKEFQFITRTVEENGEKGVRVWRRPPTYQP